MSGEIDVTGRAAPGVAQVLFGPYFLRVDELDHGYVTSDGCSSDGWGQDELIDDIAQHGIREPLEVANVTWQGARTRVFDGNHRLVAARRLCLTHVPAVDGTDVYAFEDGVDEHDRPLPGWHQVQAYRAATPER